MQRARTAGPPHEFREVLFCESWKKQFLLSEFNVHVYFNFSRPQMSFTARIYTIVSLVAFLLSTAQHGTVPLVPPYHAPSAAGEDEQQVPGSSKLKMFVGYRGRWRSAKNPTKHHLSIAIDTRTHAQTHSKKIHRDMSFQQ